MTKKQNIRHFIIHSTSTYIKYGHGQEGDYKGRLGVCGSRPTAVPNWQGDCNMGHTVGKGTGSRVATDHPHRSTFTPLSQFISHTTH